MIKFLKMAKGSFVWDETKARRILKKARDRIFGTSKEKGPNLMKHASSPNHLDSDGENVCA